MSGRRISSTAPLRLSEILNRRNILNTKPDVCFAGNQQIENRNQIGLETTNGKSKADAREGMDVQRLIVRVHGRVKQNRKHAFWEKTHIQTLTFTHATQLNISNLKDKAFGLQNSVTIKSFSSSTELIKAFVSASFEYGVPTEGLSCYLWAAEKQTRTLGVQAGLFAWPPIRTFLLSSVKPTNHLQVMEMKEAQRAQKYLNPQYSYSHQMSSENPASKQQREDPKTIFRRRWAAQQLGGERICHKHFKC